VWRIVAPTPSATDAFEVCTESLRDVELRDRLRRAAPFISAADDRYRIAGQQGLLHELDAAAFIVNDVANGEMTRLYDRSFAAANSAGRTIYDAIKLAPKNGLCPLCGQGTVASLDHFLPKSSFSALAVNPANLIPASSNVINPNLLRFPV